MNEGLLTGTDETCADEVMSESQLTRTDEGTNEDRLTSGKNRGGMFRKRLEIMQPQAH